MTLHGQTEWFKNRLQVMGPAEVLSRFGDIGRHIALRLFLNQVRPRAQSQPEYTNHLCDPSELAILLSRVHRESQDRIIGDAEQWMNHRASFFALHETRLGDTINWHYDYSSRVLSPLRYSRLINLYDMAVVGNVKYIWELNRLQHLVLLTLAAIWTDSQRYITEIEKQLCSWHSQNPFMKGINWTSPLEAGLRLISWSLVFLLMRELGHSSNVFDRDLQRSIYQHQYFIRKFYSKHSSANNHLIGEMAGLYVAAVSWPWHEHSPSWREFARRKLIEEIIAQVEPDGVSKERALEYHLFIFELFVLAGALGSAVGDSFPQAYWDRLRSMLSFLSAVSDRSGNVPVFGDGDSGQVVRLPETTPERARTLVRLGQFMDGPTTNADLRTTLLLLGQSPEEILLLPERPCKKPLLTFPQGGYYVLAADRGGRDEMVVVFDIGALGLAPLYAHAHADALSFWLSYGGHEFLIDPGTFCYHTDAPWRAYFRGTVAHNTIRVDRKDQSVPGGPFLWRQAANCRIENVNDRREVTEIAGSHDGYTRLPDPVLHTRSLRLFNNSRSLSVTDRLQCRSIHDIELLFHFSEKCDVRPVGPSSFEAINNGKRLYIRLDTRLIPELYRGSENPIFGWVSRTFGRKDPSFTLVARTAIKGTTEFVTEISAIED